MAEDVSIQSIEAGPDRLEIYHLSNRELIQLFKAQLISFSQQTFLDNSLGVTTNHTVKIVIKQISNNCGFSDSDKFEMSLDERKKRSYLVIERFLDQDRKQHPTEKDKQTGVFGIDAIRRDVLFEDHKEKFHLAVQELLVERADETAPIFESLGFNTPNQTLDRRLIFLAISFGFSKEELVEALNKYEGFEKIGISNLYQVINRMKKQTPELSRDMRSWDGSLSWTQVLEEKFQGFRTILGITDTSYTYLIRQALLPYAYVYRELARGYTTRELWDIFGSKSEVDTALKMVRKYCGKSKRVEDDLRYFLRMDLITYWDVVATKNRHYYKTSPSGRKRPTTFERLTMMEILDSSGWNIRNVLQAAQKLGFTQNNFQKRFAHYTLSLFGKDTKLTELDQNSLDIIRDNLVSGRNALEHKANLLTQQGFDKKQIRDMLGFSPTDMKPVKKILQEKFEELFYPL